jgi:microcompartment protein CcmL/EutN
MLAGKSYICLTGAESAVKEALDAGAALVREKGMLVSAIMIPRPDADLLKFVL